MLEWQNELHTTVLSKYYVYKLSMRPSYLRTYVRGVQMQLLSNYIYVVLRLASMYWTEGQMQAVGRDVAPCRFSAVDCG